MSEHVEDRSPVEVEIADSVAVLRLNRPEVHNAVDERVMRGLENALDQVDEAGLRAVILTGAGSETFSAGGDLRYFATLRTPEAARQMSERMQVILSRLDEGPRLVIGAVNGNAYGGGCEILAACHLRIAARGVRFQLRQGAMGLSTGWGGGLRLFRLLGRSRALRLLILGEGVEAEEAARIGLVDRVVEPEELLLEARRWAVQAATRPEGSIRAFLDLSRLTVGGEASEALARRRETELFLERWTSQEFQRALADFLARTRSASNEA